LLLFEEVCGPWAGFPSMKKHRTNNPDFKAKPTLEAISGGKKI